MYDERRYDPLYHHLLAADIKGSGRPDRNDQIRVVLRDTLYRVVGEALRHAAVGDADYTLLDRGDGLLVVFRPNVPIRPLIDPLVPRLVAGLASYNASVPERARMRLRVAMHSGYIVQDANGYSGQALIHMFRLLDSRLLRSRLAASGAPLVLIVSEAVYDAVVRQHDDGVDPAAYELVRVTSKEVRRARAWIWVPGRRAAAPVPSPAAMRERISNLVPQNPNFTGRDELLDELHRSFTGEPPGQGGRRQRWVQAVHGLAGVGKSQLAREYAHRHAGEYDVVWWLRADRPSTVLAGLAELAQRLHLPNQGDRDQLVDQLVTELGKRDRWLLVFDNAAEPHDLTRFLPARGHGHVLVTTRNPAFGQIAGRVRVDVLSADQAQRFLLERTGSTDAASARRLAEELGGLPLALEQAAAFVEQNGLALGEYLELYQQRRELLGSGTGSEHGASVQATFQVAFEQVARRAPAAAQLARLCAFYAAATIPHDLLCARPDLLPPLLGDAARDPSAYVETVGALHRYSLAERDQQGLRMHQLLQQAIRNSLPGAEQKAWAERAVELLGAAWPGDPQDPATWPVCRRLLYHTLVATKLADQLQVAPEATARLLRGAGIYHLEQAEPELARAALTDALAIIERTHGADDPEVALAVTHLGRALRQLDRLDEATRLFRRAVRVFEGAYGPDHPRVAWALTYLGTALRASGDHRRALDVLQRALRLHEAAHGPDSAKVAWTLTHLGRVLRRLGDHTGARDALERALVINQTIYGDDQGTAFVLTGLGRVLRRLGDHAGARDALQRALRINEVIYGPNHHYTAQTLTHLGAAQRDEGDLVTARAVLERALAIDEAVYGPDHFRTAWTLTHLGRVLRRRREHAKARDALERALQISERTRGSKHAQVAWVLTHLSTVVQAEGRLRDAKAMLERALAIDEAVYGADHPEVAWVLTHLSAVTYELGQLRSAEAMLDRALAITETTYGTDHPDVAWALTHVGTALHRAGQLTQAKASLERALAIVETIYGRSHPQVALTLIPLGLTLRDLGDRDTARALLERASIILAEARLGPDHPETRGAANALRDLGAGASQPAARPASRP